MKLTDTEINFIVQNRTLLTSIHKRRIEMFKDEIIKMPSGEQRDVFILFVRDSINFINEIENYYKSSLKKEKKSVI